MIKAVICDHGGVLSTRDETTGALDRWRSQLGLDSESFQNALFDRDLGDQMAIGAVTQEDGSKLIAGLLGIDLPTLERLRQECWSAPIVNAQLIEFLESLKPAVKVACLTNWSVEARAVMEKRGGSGLRLDRRFGGGRACEARPEDLRGNVGAIGCLSIGSHRD